MTKDLLESTDSLTSLGAPRPASVLDIMLHPWRTLMLLEHMAQDLAYIPALRDGLREAAMLLDAQRCENVALSARNTDMAVRLRETLEALARTREALEKAEERLEDYEAVDEAMKQFTEQLSQAETMKRKYEQRISTLKAQLRDTRDALTTLTGLDYSDDLQVIDMRDPIPNTVNLPPHRPAHPEQEQAEVQPEETVQEEQETPPLPDSPGPIMPPPKRHRKPSPYLPPASERLRTDDSDWWVDLPEEL